jgi:hypothetical protein
VNPDIAFASVGRLLVVLHAAAAIVLIGSATHHALIAWGYLRGAWKLRLGRIYAAVVACAYAVTTLFGLLAYPAFRYNVRAIFLDRYEPWASNLFDTKENFAMLGLPLVVIAFGLSRVMGKDDDRALHWAYAGCVWVTALIVWFDVFSGLVIALTKGL